MKYTMESRIRFSEVDENGQLSLPGLIDYFQDCATFQSESLGLGYDYLAAKGQAWILSSWQIGIGRMPRLYEKIETATWAYDFKAFFGLRNFTLKDEAGDVCVWANSAWVLYDMRRRCPVKVPAQEAAAYGAEAPWEMDYASRKIRLPDMPGEQLGSFRVERIHLDRNKHVNNAQYIAMAAAYLPENFRISGLRAEYREQAHLGDEIHVRRIWQDDKIFICLENGAGNAYTVVEAAGSAGAPEERGSAAQKKKKTKAGGEQC